MQLKYNNIQLTLKKTNKKTKKQTKKPQTEIYK